MSLPIPMTTSEVARALEVSADTVRALERRGVLPAQKTQSGVRLFDPKAVQRVAEARERERRGR